MDKITNGITDFDNQLFSSFNNKKHLIRYETNIIHFLNTFDYVKKFSINYEILEYLGGSLLQIIDLEIDENIYILDKLLGENDLNFIYEKINNDFIMIGLIMPCLKINGKIYYYGKNTKENFNG